MAFFRKNYREKTDEELMLLLTERKQQAFDELYARYSKSVLNFFFRMLNFDREKAEDMLHDLFLKIIEKPHLFDSSKTFSTWIFSIAHNMVKNEYRNQQVRTEYKNYQSTTQEQTVTSSEKIDKDLFHQKLQAELEKIDAELRTLFNLRFTEEMSIKQIAEILECPEGTVKSRLFYLTKNLSTKLFLFKPEK